jgi:hypothetical protein
MACGSYTCRVSRKFALFFSSSFVRSPSSFTHPVAPSCTHPHRSMRTCCLDAVSLSFVMYGMGSRVCLARSPLKVDVLVIKLYDSVRVRTYGTARQCVGAMQANHHHHV